jgi:alanine racemase
MHHPETLRKWCGGEWLTAPSESPITELAIDTRKVNSPKQAMFIALRTSRRNGHDFIRAAYDAGIRLFLISKEINTGLYHDAAFILVKDTGIALQAIAAGHRKQYNIPVIGITGSNGKTVVKEWLYQSLGDTYNIVRSPKSYNSQIGVPLSVWLMGRRHELGIFEAGISQPGEMDGLEKIIRPSIGIFTNIGEAHSEGFLNVRQKINEKLQLFRNAGTLIYCRDYPELHECIVHFNNLTTDDSEEPRRIISWSSKGDADLLITAKESSNNHTTLQATYRGEQISITIPFSDAASVENATQVWCTLLYLGLDNATISERLAQLQPVEMRLETRSGINDCTILNDAYNSDLTSLAISLDYLESQRKHAKRTVILSDMLQMGKPDATLYEEVANMIIRRGVHRFIGIGPALYRHKELFRAHRDLRSKFYKSTADFLKNFHLLTFENEGILLKGARAFAFEQIASVLEEEVHQTVLSINIPSLTHNLNVFRNRVGPDVKIMAMVKAFSYGTGSHEIASALQFAGVDYLSVAYTDEGVVLRKAGITLPIMVMSPEATAFDRMIAWKLEPEIYNMRSLHAFTRMAETLSVTAYPIHIKLDTGMHRLGFEPKEMDALIASLESNKQVHVASIFSHLAAAEDPAHDPFTARQASVFSACSEQLIKALGYIPIRHLCNTAGIARHPELHFDMVRLGLGLYGIDSSSTFSADLQQISTLRTTIAQVKDVAAGEGVGYGHNAVSDHQRRIATISIGYADGYPRALGHGRAHVLIHNKPAPLVGIVCMDMCMVDISNIPEAAEGDEVIVFGPQLPLTVLAGWGDTIPYEMMTGISQRVKRVYVAES